MMYNVLTKFFLFTLMFSRFTIIIKQIRDSSKPQSLHTYTINFNICSCSFSSCCLLCFCSSPQSRCKSEFFNPGFLSSFFLTDFSIVFWWLQNCIFCSRQYYFRSFICCSSSLLFDVAEKDLPSVFPRSSLWHLEIWVSKSLDNGTTNYC